MNCTTAASPHSDPLPLFMSTTRCSAGKTIWRGLPLFLDRRQEPAGARAKIETASLWKRRAVVALLWRCWALQRNHTIRVNRKDCLHLMMGQTGDVTIKGGTKTACLHLYWLEKWNYYQRLYFFFIYLFFYNSVMTLPLLCRQAPIEGKKRGGVGGTGLF